jgi:hypothetical protein
MIGKLRTIDERLLLRRCVACGYDGALLRDGSARRCARCGCDLAERPARSYAEMEGLLGMEEDWDEQSDAVTPHSEEGLIHRWLAFAFLTLIGLVTIAYLAAAAMSV